MKENSPNTKITFSPPYFYAAEPRWLDHPMGAESDGLIAECTRSEVMDWLLSIRKPHQRVMTTIVGRIEEGECEASTWREWYDKGCDFFGYAHGRPPHIKLPAMYDQEFEIVRQAFNEMS